MQSRVTDSTDEMKLYRFHWLDGKVEECKGYGVADAFTRLGYGGGAFAALDYWELVNVT